MEFIILILLRIIFVNNIKVNHLTHIEGKKSRENNPHGRFLSYYFVTYKSIIKALLELAFFNNVPIPDNVFQRSSFSFLANK